MHLDEEQLQRLLHGQPSARVDAGSHLAQCKECRERLVKAELDEREVFALLRQVDHPLPAVDVGALAARARRTGLAWGRWAAGVLFVLGAAGAAYAVPGSPVRRWMHSAAAWIDGAGQVPAPPRQADTLSAPGAGIAAVPGKNYVIAFRAVDTAGQARVSLTESSEVTVRAPAGAAGFTSVVDRLLINNQRAGSGFEIQIPRAAVRVEIRVAGKRIFLKQGERVTAGVPADSAGEYLLRLSDVEGQR